MRRSDFFASSCGRQESGDDSEPQAAFVRGRCFRHLLRYSLRRGRNHVRDGGRGNATAGNAVIIWRPFTAVSTGIAFV